jgi:hypothetical protein
MQKVSGTWCKYHPISGKSFRIAFVLECSWRNPCMIGEKEGMDNSLHVVIREMRMLNTLVFARGMMHDTQSARYQQLHVAFKDRDLRGSPRPFLYIFGNSRRIGEGS